MSDNSYVPIEGTLCQKDKVLEDRPKDVRNLINLLIDELKRIDAMYNACFEYDDDGKRISFRIPDTGEVLDLNEVEIEIPLYDMYFGVIANTITGSINRLANI